MQSKKAARRALALVSAGLFCYVALSNIVYSLVSHLMGAPAEGSILSLLTEILCFTAGMTGALLVLEIKGEPWNFKKINGTQRNAAIFAIPALLLPINYLSSTLDSALRGIGIVSFEGSMAVPEGPLGFILFFIQSVILPVFFEELLFRGLILKRLRPYGDAFAIIASSLFFAFMHNTLYAMPAIFLLGVIFCLADITCDSLLPSVIMHTVNNGITVVSWACMGSAELTSRFSASLGFLMLFSAVSLPFLLLSMKRRQGRIFTAEKGGLSPALIFTSIPTLGFLAFMGVLIARVTEVAV